jgi:hypothetical protein
MSAQLQAAGQFLTFLGVLIAALALRQADPLAYTAFQHGLAAAIVMCGGWLLVCGHFNARFAPDISIIGSAAALLLACLLVFDAHFPPKAPSQRTQARDDANQPHGSLRKNATKDEQNRKLALPPHSVPATTPVSEPARDDTVPARAWTELRAGDFCCSNEGQGTLDGEPHGERLQP